MFVQNAINAIDKVLMSKGNPGRNGINFGSGTEISVYKIAELVIKYAAKHSTLKAINLDSRPVEVVRLFADISEANKLQEFEPQISFEKGLSLLIDWYKNCKSELWDY
jgi:dTDP-L-rhamnose 4-epimerase